MLIVENHNNLMRFSIIPRLNNISLINNDKKAAAHELKKSVVITINFLLRLEVDNKNFLKRISIIRRGLVRYVIFFNCLYYSKPNNVDINTERSGV